MTDHVWRWQAAEEHPTGSTYDGDGWYVCIECGASKRDNAHSELGMPFPAGAVIPTRCPRNQPTAILCTRWPPVHAISAER
jgi:hypothetical protein